MKYLLWLQPKIKDTGGQDPPLICEEHEAPTVKKITKKNADRFAAHLVYEESDFLKRALNTGHYIFCGKSKVLKSIRCPHCKLNLVKEFPDLFTRMVEGLARTKEPIIVRCRKCDEFYTVANVKDGFKMEW